MFDLIKSVYWEIMSYFVPEKMEYEITGKCKKCGKCCNYMYSYDTYTPEEFKIIQQHPSIGVQKILEPNPLLHDLIPIVKYHHEQWNGKGYPCGLKEEEIPLAARIVAIAEDPYSLARLMLIILYLGHLSRMIICGIWFFPARPVIGGRMTGCQMEDF